MATNEYQEDEQKVSKVHDMIGNSPQDYSVSATLSEINPVFDNERNPQER